MADSATVQGRAEIATHKRCCDKASCNSSAAKCRVDKVQFLGLQQQGSALQGPLGGFRGKDTKTPLTSAPCGSGCGLPASSISCRAACPCSRPSSLSRAACSALLASRARPAVSPACSGQQHKQQHSVETRQHGSSRPSSLPCAACIVGQPAMDSSTGSNVQLKLGSIEAASRPVIPRCLQRIVGQPGMAHCIASLRSAVAAAATTL
jgi:hypothetical protein